MLGVALCIDLQARFPWRSIHLVHHTSGVTERKLEIDLQVLGFEVEMYEDFQHSNQVSYQKDLRIFPRKLVKGIARFLQFHSASNTDYEYARLKPWVLSIRGHYSHRTLSDESLTRIAELIGISNQLDSSKDHDTIVVHYRLGDLVDIHNKSYIDPTTISRVISNTANSFNLNCIRIYSDSPEIVWELLGRSFQDYELEIVSRTTLQTICELVKSRVFVGTNSKISIWVAILRDHMWSDKPSFLPKQLIDSFSCQNPSFAQEQVIFYD